MNYLQGCPGLSSAPNHHLEGMKEEEEEKDKDWKKWWKNIVLKNRYKLEML